MYLSAVGLKQSSRTLAAPTGPYLNSVFRKPEGRERFLTLSTNPLLVLKQTSENLVADHLSRLEHGSEPHDEANPINELFPDESFLVVEGQMPNVLEKELLGIS